MTLVYAEEPQLAAQDFVDVLARAGGGGAAADAARVEAVLAGSDLIVAARDGAAEGALVGLARCVTDHATVCVCADLVVDAGYQAHGVGRKLLESVRGLLPAQCRLLVTAGADVGPVADGALSPADGVFEAPAGA